MNTCKMCGKGTTFVGFFLYGN